MHELKEDFYKQLGQLLQNKRKEMSLTQAAVADSLSISRATIANLEAGDHRILLHHLLELSFLLGIDLNGVAVLYRKSKLADKVAKAPGSFREALNRLQSCSSKMRDNETTL